MSGPRDLSRVLVTGGAGFIGSHLVDQLLARGAERVVVVDDYFLGFDANLASAKALDGDRLVVYRDDARDQRMLAAILERERPTVVFNLAVRPLLYSFMNPATAFDVNTDIALTLAELLRAGEYERLVHLSSSEVYGSAVAVPMSESHPLLPETTYAAGKAAADLALASYVRMFGLDITTVRPFNNYGPRQNKLGMAALVPLTIERLRSGQPPVVQGDGLQTRDFIFVEDTARLLVRVAEQQLPTGTAVNLGSGRETTVLEIVEQLRDVMNVTTPVAHEEARVADVRRHCADTASICALIGDLELTPLRDGLERTVSWYLENS